MTWELIAIVFGSLISAIGALLVWNQQATKKIIGTKFDEIILRLDSQDERIDKQDEKIDKQSEQMQHLEKLYLLCKQGCQQDFVSAEQFVRNESYNRQKLDAIAESVSLLAGNMKIIEQMPNICGQIASNIVKQMKG